MPITKSPFQLAEALAKKCADDYFYGYCTPDPELSKQILQSLALVELSECYEALLMIKESCSAQTGYVTCVLECKEIADSAISKLNTKLTTLLGEQG